MQSTGLEHTCSYVWLLRIFFGHQPASRHQLLGLWRVGEARLPKMRLLSCRARVAHCAPCPLYILQHLDTSNFSRTTTLSILSPQYTILSAAADYIYHVSPQSMSNTILSRTYSIFLRSCHYLMLSIWYPQQSQPITLDQHLDPWKRDDITTSWQQSYSSQ